nr:polycomb group protein FERTILIZATION-INDEPENDENT ENDOSPERM isoform X1 [Ipomoea batatas]
MKEHSPGEGTVDILQKYPVPECDIWFIKFSCDFQYKAAAIGRMKVLFFQLDITIYLFQYTIHSSLPAIHSPSKLSGVEFILKYMPESFPLIFNVLGNREGKIYVWDLQTSPPVLIARLSHVQSKSAIRQTAVSFDGSTILSCCEDGMIWRWDVVSTS